MPSRRPSLPAELVKKPVNYKKLALAIIIICLFIEPIFNYFTYGTHESCMNLTVLIRYIIIFTIAEITIRLSQFIEYYCKSRCDNSTLLKKIAKQIFVPETTTIIAFLLSIILLLLFGFDKVFFEDIYYIPIIAAYLWMKTFNYESNVYVRSLWVENSKGLDYGSGMAYSFFYGYLNIVLPDLGDENKNIEETMKLYEAKEGIRFTQHKLYMIINRKLFCPPDLNQFCRRNDVKMQPCKTLLEIKRNRAGVQSRSYKNSVYKIYKTGVDNPYYVVTEGATPLHTFYETLLNNGEHQQYYQQNMDEIVLQFYHTLKHLLENSERCKDLCELVYFDSGAETNLGEVLLRKMNVREHNE